MSPETYTGTETHLRLAALVPHYHFTLDLVMLRCIPLGALCWEIQGEQFEENPVML